MCTYSPANLQLKGSQHTFLLKIILMFSITTEGLLQVLKMCYCCTNSKSSDAPKILTKSSHILLFRPSESQIRGTDYDSRKTGCSQKSKNQCQKLREGRQASNVETAHVMLFSYTFIMPDYSSSGFLLLLSLPTCITFLWYEWLSNVNYRLKLKINFLLHSRFFARNQRPRHDTVHLGSRPNSRCTMC